MPFFLYVRRFCFFKKIQIHLVFLKCKSYSPCAVPKCDTTGGQCVFTPAAKGTVCRVAKPTDVCDVPETCDGTLLTCPDDTYRPNDYQCRAANGPCDVPEFCSGFSASCGANVYATAIRVCRNATGPCDISEQCSGTSADCPVNAFRQVGEICDDGYLKLLNC